MYHPLLTLVLLLSCITRSYAAAAALVSPEIHPDHTITFRVAAPKATTVTLTGDWVTAAQPLTKGDDGTWSVTLGPFVPSTYIYSFNVDDVATVDPINPRIKLRAKGSANLVEVLGDTPGVQEARDVPHGDVQTNWQKSTVLGGETRRFLVYTPPGYNQDSTHHYPVLFLLHGSNDTSDGWSNVGNVNFIADNLIADKKMTPMLIVMPNFYALPTGTPAASNSRGGGGGGGNAGNNVFYNYLLQEILPLITTKYRTAPGRENLAVAGMSMGANQSLDLFLTHYDQFSSVGVFCASNYNGFESAHAAFFADAKATNAKLGVFWVGCGRQDPGHFNGSQTVANVLEAHQITHIWHPTEGVHNYVVWRDYLVEFLPLIFQPAAVAAAPAAH